MQAVLSALSSALDSQCRAGIKRETLQQALEREWGTFVWLTCDPK